MEFLAKVINGLECASGQEKQCKNCGYANSNGGGRYPKCHMEAAADALEIIKTQKVMIDSQQKQIDSQQATILKLNNAVESAYDQGFDNGQKNVLEAQEG